MSKLGWLTILVSALCVMCIVPGCGGQEREITVTGQPVAAPAPLNNSAVPPSPVVTPVLPNQPAASPATSNAAPKTDAVIELVGSKNSNKYHLPACEWAVKIGASNKVKFASPQEAQAKGYTACKVCKPP